MIRQCTYCIRKQDNCSRLDFSLCDGVLRYEYYSNFSVQTLEFLISHFPKNVGLPFSLLVSLISDRCTTLAGNIVTVWSGSVLGQYILAVHRSWRYISPSWARCKDSRILAVYVRPTKTPHNLKETHWNGRIRREKINNSTAAAFRTRLNHHDDHTYVLFAFSTFSWVNQSSTPDPNIAFEIRPRANNVFFCNLVKPNHVKTCLRQGACSGTLPSPAGRAAGGGRGFAD